MPTVTQVNDLKINKLTKAQYDAAVQAGTIGENEISVITDLDATPQVDSLPTAAAAQEGKIYQYIGATDQNYTNGYFYKCSTQTVYNATVAFEPGSESGATLSCSGSDFASFVASYTSDPTIITQVFVGYTGTDFGFVGFDSHDELVIEKYHLSLSELESAGFSFSDTPIINDGFIGTCTITASSGGYSWQQVNVQPAPTVGDARITIRRNGYEAGYFTTNATEDQSININVPEIQLTTMPEATPSIENKVVQYIGQTDANYTHGYIYECVGTQTQASAVGTQTAGSGLTNIQVDVAAWEEGTGMTEDGSLTMHYFGDGWNLTPNAVGVTFDGTPVADDEITVVYTAGTTSCSWERVDVQPTQSGLPSQTGQSGKFLTTDGTDASWSDKPLVNTATQPDSGALGILANVTGHEALGIKTNKGLGTRSITIGSGSETQTGTESEMAIGRTAKAFGSYACAIGNQANAYGANCHAIGYNAHAGNYQSYSTYGAWQFGSGTNTEAGTVCFALTTSNDYQHWTNYKLLDSNGTIPEARLADTTSATEGQVLQLDSNSNAVWETPVVATFRTWGANE